MPPNELRNARTHQTLFRPYNRNRFNPARLGCAEVKRRRDANKRLCSEAVSAREIVVGSAVRTPGWRRAFDFAA